MSRFAPLFERRTRAFTSLAAAGALVTAALLGAPASALAAPPAADTPQTTVFYSVRDLSTSQGTRALYGRIMSAARAVCPAYDQRDLNAYAYSHRCQQQAVARAIRQIGNPRLAGAHAHATAHRG